MKQGNRTKYTVLGMLSINSMSGYEIVKNIKNSTNHFWSESEGQIYPALTLCVNEGFASCKEEASIKGAQRMKKVYTITRNGKKELQTWLKKEPQNTLVRNELLLKLFFGDNMNQDDNIHHITHKQKDCEAEIANYEKMRQAILLKDKHIAHHNFWLITLDYGFKTAKAELAWCKDALKILRSE